MRWLMITRKLDLTDDRAGFMMQWVNALAARLDHLDVICQENAHPVLPPNVRAYSMGKESGQGRTAQAWNLTRHLARLTPQADGVFCHMMPRYVIFDAPWARLYRKPLVHWYTHRTASRELRMARQLATHIMTAAPGSYPLPTPKLIVMGHGIDTSLFPHAGQEGSPPEVVTVGRLSRIKGQDRLLRAASLVAREGGPHFRVRIVGGTVEHDPGYAAELEALPTQLDPAPDAILSGPLPHSTVAEVFLNCAAAVNLSPPGLFDKAALEPMFAGKPVIVTNRDFMPLLGDHADLLYLPHDASDEQIARTLGAVMALSPAERAAIGADLRARALAEHALDSLMDRMVSVLGAITHHTFCETVPDA